ncbi:MAG: hypothetical protein J7527_01580 [Chitinophagaceae bacterium]|nr:hypothetical protein [Chitinophagaceae bacterium]
MKYPVLLFLLVLFRTIDLCGQETAAQQAQSLLKKAVAQRPKNGDTSRQMDVVLGFVDQAISICDRHGLHREFYESSMLKVDMLLFSGRVRALQQMFEVSRDSLKIEVARNISRYYNDAHFEARNLVKAVEYAKLSLELSLQMNDLIRRINAHNQLGFVYWNANDLDNSEANFLQVVTLAKDLKSEHAAYPYMFLIRINDMKGYLNRAIQFGLEGISYLERSGYREYLYPTYHTLARIYGLTGKPEKSIEFYNVAQKEALRRKDTAGFWYTTRGMLEHLLSPDKLSEAQRILDDSYRILPPANAGSIFYSCLISAKINTALGKYQLAEEFLHRCERVNKDPEYRPAINKAFAELYFATGQLENAKSSIELTLREPSNWTGVNIASAHYLGYRIDSARNDLPSALSHFRISRKIIDSLNTISRQRQIEEMTMQYQTEKITRDVKFKEQTIQLMEKQQALLAAEFAESRLKFVIDSTEKQNRFLSMSATAAKQDKELAVNQRNIDQLESDNASRQASLENATFTRNVILLVVFLLAMVLLMVYRQYKSKQTANKIIDKKNTRLEELVRQKQALVEEKDWLLKEIHHRVKNNLQTVISLLESQSYYLDSEALTANQVSRNRVYAMSLVHQKLYQTENVASVQMDTYLCELVDNLRDCMETKGIQFVLKLVEIQLDVSQAISLGLILNEAITNSIKHAFPNGTNGAIINVLMRKEEDGKLLFLISDNGVGVSEDVQRSRPTSLGLKLIRGLTEDLEGELNIRAGEGTVITVSFIPKDPFSALSGQLDSE